MKLKIVDPVIAEEISKLVPDDLKYRKLVIQFLSLIVTVAKEQFKDRDIKELTHEMLTDLAKIEKLSLIEMMYDTDRQFINAVEKLITNIKHHPVSDEDLALGFSPTTTFDNG